MLSVLVSWERSTIWEYCCDRFLREIRARGAGPMAADRPRPPIPHAPYVVCVWWFLFVERGLPPFAVDLVCPKQLVSKTKSKAGMENGPLLFNH